MFGFPPIVKKKEKKISTETLESRGFSTTNIIDIADILEKKKNRESFIILGSDEENGYNSENIEISAMLNDKPHTYNKIIYNDNISRKKNKK